jgi:hypothetical protein
MKKQCLINNKLVNGTEWLSIYSPETKELLGMVPNLHESEVLLAYKSAKISFDN